MMKRSILLSFVVIALVLAGSARADLITVQEVNPTHWDVFYGPGPANTALGGYDIDFALDSPFSVFGVVIGPYLGANLNLSFSSMFYDATGQVLTVQEVSLLDNSELIGMQPASFLLFEIYLDLPQTSMPVLHAELADGFGNPIEEQVVPEPATSVLIGSGLIALARRRKK